MNGKFDLRGSGEECLHWLNTGMFHSLSNVNKHEKTTLQSLLQQQQRSSRVRFGFVTMPAHEGT